MEFFDISDRKCDGVSLSLDRVSPEDPERGWVPAYHFFIINEKGETSIKEVYAGGDVAPLGASTAINAMGAGKRAAKTIIEALL